MIYCRDQHSGHDNNIYEHNALQFTFAFVDQIIHKICSIKPTINNIIFNSDIPLIF